MIDVAKLQNYKRLGWNENNSLGIGDDLPSSIEPISEVIKLAWDRHPDVIGRFRLYTERMHFKAGDRDPFSVELGDSAVMSMNGLAHMDPEATINVSDVHPTVFYPKDKYGQPDMSRGWQPQPGQIVEFGADVWHSPEYDIPDSGVRNIVIVAIPPK